MSVKPREYKVIKEGTIPGCVHYWMLPTSNASVIVGTCQACGMEKEHENRFHAKGLRDWKPSITFENDIDRWIDMFNHQYGVL